MLHLTESARARERRRGGMLVSVAAHTAVIVGAVVATASGGEPARRADRPQAVRVTYVPLERARTTNTVRRQALGARPSVLGGAEIGFEAPRIDFTRIPVGIPDPAAALAGVPIAPATAGDALARAVTGHGGPAAPLPAGDAYLREQVDRVAVLRQPAPVPDYPTRLRAAGVEGRVVLRFVVDTAGRVEPASVEVLQASHDDLARAARAVLSRWRFVPAEVRGGRVRMLVEVPVEFGIRRDGWSNFPQTSP